MKNERIERMKQEKKNKKQERKNRKMKRNMKRIFLIGISFFIFGCNTKPKISCFKSGLKDFCFVSDKISEIEICEMTKENGQIYLNECEIYEFK